MPKYEIATTHYGTIQFLYGDGAGVFSDRRQEIEDKIRAKLEELVEQYAVVENESFCCQGEGYQIQGEDKEQVEAAIKALATYMSRFKQVEFIS